MTSRRITLRGAVVVFSVDERQAARVDGENLADLVYESTFAAALRIGLGANLAHDMARQVDADIRRQRGGERLYVPAPSRQDRDRRIIEALDRGDSVVDIAARERVCRGTVYKLRRAVAEAGG